MRSLTTDARRTLVTAFVANRVDYCNAVLYMARLLQSHAGYRWYWIPSLVWSLVPANMSTSHRCFVTFFIGCQSLDTVQDCSFDLRLCPKYRSCLPQASHLSGFGIVTSVTPFGWSRRLKLFVLRVNTSIGQRSFSIAAPVVWNALPPDFRSPLNSRRQFRCWKLIFSDKPTTLHDSSAENNCLRVKLCNCKQWRITH